jgi:two-component system sensor histidine kinase CpxA
MSVFSKLVISFWLAVALSMMTTVILYPPSHRDASHFPELKAGLDLNAQYLVSLLETNRAAAARTYCEQLGKQDLHLYVFDSHGNQLIGRPAPAPVLAMVAQDSQQPRTAKVGDRLYASELEVLKDGTQVSVVAEFPDRHPPLFIRMAPRMALLALISGLVCYGLAKYLTIPLVALRHATHKLAEGDLSARAISPTRGSKDEISSLVADFNAMADQIESLVTLQNRLTTDISHELRSPLARLSVALEIARAKSGPQAAGALDRIETEADRLNELVGQILMLSRLESGNDPTAPDQIDVPELLQDVADDASFEATKKGCTVNLNVSARCSVQGSRELLRRSLDNVLRNAINYTASGSSIEVSLECKNGELPALALIRIRDHGVGVPENELKNIFQPFHRVGGDRARQSGGAGLGLAIADRAVRLHHGMISARNAPDGGLIIEVALPASMESEGEAAAKRRRDADTVGETPTPLKTEHRV